MAHSIPVGQIQQLGDSAFLVGVENALAGRALASALRRADWNDVTDVVGGLATVMVAFDSPLDAQPFEDRLAQLMHDVGVSGAGDVRSDSHIGHLEVPCLFDGPDLDEVAAALSCSTEHVVELVTGSPLTVAVVGFSPGFAYLAGLPEPLTRLPRRAQPRAVVAAGSVALANGHAAVYPSASPGGWQLIGRTNETFFTDRHAPYARLSPGDQVHFVAVDQLPEPKSWVPEPRVTEGATSGAALSVRGETVDGDPAFLVEDAGLWTVLQDGGRRRVAALGVPGAGPADSDSHRLANGLVGNRSDAAALEITAHGPTLLCVRPVLVAVVGGEPDVHIDGQRVEAGRVLPVTTGQHLSVGSLRGGFRTYLAVAGGFVGSAVIGSVATDQLSRLGPGPMQRGDALGAAALTLPLGDHLSSGVVAMQAVTDSMELRVVPGPHRHLFRADAWNDLVAMEYLVAGESNRVGLRLQPTEASPPLMRSDGDAVDIDSHGVVTGSVQIPPTGSPVILMPDHATMGGYPILAVVARVDHGRLGQCAPGTRIRLRPITHEEAGAAWTIQQRVLGHAVVGHYPLAVD